MRPTVVTRRLMPGTMRGDAGYPSLGYRLVTLIGGSSERIG